MRRKFPSSLCTCSKTTTLPTGVDLIAVAMILRKDLGTSKPLGQLEASFRGRAPIYRVNTAGVGKDYRVIASLHIPWRFVRQEFDCLSEL